jgi:hypothetical protein
MGKLNKLDIQFDNPQNVCWSGDVMKGYVIVELNDICLYSQTILRLQQSIQKMYISL